MSEIDEEVKLLENLLDVALAKVKRNDGPGTLRAMEEALETARRLPRKEK
jgi:hypothetical protein